MPTIEENVAEFGEAWSESGDEWSGAWGDAETQWHATLLPRVRHFLPAGRILEIAPGHGRWSQFLIPEADEFVGVDLNEACIAACRRRFREAAYARFETNDGSSLAAVADNSVDFAFSFDSLVHVEFEVLSAYLRELGRKLSADGVAWIHHSNLGELSRTLSYRLTRMSRGKPLVAKSLEKVGAIGWDNWRAPSVTAKAVEAAAREAGLTAIGQEIFEWGDKRPKLIDCISVLARPGSKWDRPNVVARNPFFMNEAKSARSISKVFTSFRSPKR
ncbi:MAG TPA: class I SAM-dependent methyltransferase [Allosphingosinicella sp.]